MEKKVTKEEVERVLEQYLTPITKEPILNELFPPEFKVGDKVMVIGIRSIEAHSLNGEVVELKNVTNNTVSTYVGMHYGMHLDEVRHATPEEIAAAEQLSWKPKARALELFPIYEEFDVDRLKELREAYLQGWQEAQQDKQTCGFCVEQATELTDEKHSESLDTKENEGSELPSEKH